MNINGHRISVQFGTGNYVDSDIRYGRQKNVDNNFDTSMNFAVWQSNLAEVMIDVIDGDGAIMRQDAIGLTEDPIFGWCSAECVAKFIGCLADAQPGDDITAAINQIYQSNPNDYNLVPVFCFEKKSYRMININTIQELKVSGNVFGVV
jgi:hypothetical protein